MNLRSPTQTKQPLSFTPVLTGLLQRKCISCGQHMIAGGACTNCQQKRGLQRKLSIGASNDPLELEADRIADRVLATPTNTNIRKTPPHIQRFTGQTASQTDVAPASVDRVLSSPGSPLDTGLQQDMGQRFGHDFSHVRVHTGTAAEQSAREVSAYAYTVRQDIVFSNGRFAPGTHEGRRLIAHELTHVVQQSGADMQANNQLPVSKSVQQHIMQRKKVPTDFGEFETTKFAEADGRGVEITLKFAPDDSKVDAKKIALSQSIRNTIASGDAYALSPNQATKMVASGKSGAGYAIDTLEGANNPLYGEKNTLGPTQDLKDTPASANTTTGPVNVGVNTNYELGYCYKEKPTDASKKKHPATLWDKPRGGKKKGESMTFETAALAIEGTDKDKYYGSVKWGYKMEGTDAAPTVTKTDIDSASKGTPTANFIEPAKLWNVGKTPGTIKVTADPEATVLKGDQSSTEKLAKDTKVKQLDVVMWGASPAIKAEVLKADGTGSGKIIYIKIADVKDMGDGSATKKLPVPAAKPYLPGVDKG
jgi:Domain of unknown function (DUF4157)